MHAMAHGNQASNVNKNSSIAIIQRLSHSASSSESILTSTLGPLLHCMITHLLHCPWPIGGNAADNLDGPQ